MNVNRLRNILITGILGLVLITTVQAGTPLWAFALVSGYPPAVEVSATGTVIIKYTVTNQSHKPHILLLTASISQMAGKYQSA